MRPLILSKIVPKDMDGYLLREFLSEKLKLSRTAVKKVKFDGGELRVNGREVSVREPLQTDDQVEVIFPPEKNGAGIIPTSMQLNLLYEDDVLIVLNKPAGQPTVPSMQNREAALANGVLYYLESKGLAFTAHPVTRLDRNTSGLVLFAKHSVAHDWLSRMQKKGEIHRSYIALVEGHIEQQAGTINAPIGRKPGSIIERCVTSVGKTAVTHFKVLEQYDQYAVIQLFLETGRTHQIRVHLAHIGHPLLGDNLYRGSVQYISRHALHCQQLYFKHPLTNEQMKFKAPLPADMGQLVEKKD